MADNEKVTSLSLLPSFRYSNRRAKRLTIYITILNHANILMVGAIEDAFFGNNSKKMNPKYPSAYAQNTQIGYCISIHENLFVMK